MTKFVQANMHRSRTADALLSQIVTEKEADVVIISEQYKRIESGIWLEDESHTAAIWVPLAVSLSIINSGVGNGFVWARTAQYTIISCYLTPSDAIEDFEVKLMNIEDKAAHIQGFFIIAGDFNAKAVEWGSSTTNSRGRRILDMAARLGLVIANTGTANTFRRPGCEPTTPDVTLISERLAGKLTYWQVLEDYNGSDHQYLEYKLEESGRNEEIKLRQGTRKWRADRLNASALISKLDELLRNIETPQNAESHAAQVMQAIIAACNASMPKVNKKPRRQPVYWWNEEIAELRRVCIQKRRRLTRARSRGLSEIEAGEYKNAKKLLKFAILRSKKAKWEELRNDVNENPWGTGYKIVMRKLGANQPTPTLTSDQMERIVTTLFPNHEVTPPRVEQQREAPPLFTVEELQTAAKTLKCNKAPGPDGIPNEVLKDIAVKRPQILLNMYNSCLEQGAFPSIWKKQQLTLISKGKGDPKTAEAYRPLCMLNTGGKLLEKMLKPRICAAIEDAGGLSERQHGFRPGRSTLGAIQDVIDSVQAAQRGNHYSRRLVLLATLDVRNAFNSVRWRDIIDTAENRYRLPPYQMAMLRSYLSDRELIYNTSDGLKIKQVTSGAAQGSILGPDLWNINYDAILDVEMPDDTHLVAFADDIAVVITARNTSEAQIKLNVAMRYTQAWLESRGLKLAAEKTELLFLTNRHIELQFEMQVSSSTIFTQKAANYLGVRLDCKLKYWAQIKHAATKAGKATASLSRLMANVGGPTQNKRKLLMTTINSILLYGSEIWADALNANCRRRLYAAVQRTASLRVASAYRTVSEPAVLVISDNIPIDLLAQEKKRSWDASRRGESTDTSELRNETLRLWQERWSAETRGRWTRNLIPTISMWVNRNFGEVNYYITQMLSNHGYFSSYLYKTRKVTNPCCIFGDSSNDDAEHTFFECIQWQAERRALEIRIGTCSATNIIAKMLETAEGWAAIAAFVEDVLRKKKPHLDAAILEREQYSGGLDAG